MSRSKGTFNFAANFEGLLKAPIDARQLVNTYADLTNSATWSGSTGVWLYNGAIVVVGSDPTPANNGIYWLCDANNYAMTCSWIKAGTGAGSGTVTGATNGLHTILSGTTVALGGELITGTTIDGGGLYDLRIVNVSGFQVSGGTSEIILEPAGITLGFSGQSVSFDSNAGLTYDGDYSGNFAPESLANAGYVTGLTSGLQADINYISGVTDNNICRLNTIESEYLTGATNGLTKYTCHDVCLGGTLSSPIEFAGSDSNHLCYAGDYSGGYTCRSIPDVNYVNNIASGLLAKGAVCAATTGATDFVYPQSGLTMIDGIQTTVGMRILVKDPPNSIDNGIWLANTGLWTRAGDFDGTPTGETVSGSYMWVLSGNTNKDTSWVLNTSDPIIVHDPPQTGDTPLNFVLYNHVQDVTAGTGITVTMVTGTHIISLNPSTQAMLAKSITGVTSVGGGESIISGTSGHDIYLKSVIGSGATTVINSGDTIIIYSNGEAYNFYGSGATQVSVSGSSVTINTPIDMELLSGSTNPVANSAITSVINLILDVIAVPPTYYAPTVSLTPAITQTVEMGTTLGSFAANITFTQNDAGAATGYELCRNGSLCSTSATNTITGETNITSAISYVGKVSYACGITKCNNIGIPDPTGKILAGTISSTRTITPVLRQFWGNAASVPTTSANVRALGNCNYCGTNTFSLTTGTVNCVFAFAVPNTKSKVCVIDVGNLGADITGCYVLCGGGSFVVCDIGGNPHNYNVYVMQTAIPYPASTTHAITIS